MFETPRCDVCNLKCETISTLDVHMKVTHGETDNSRIQRRVKMAANAHEKSKRLHRQGESKSYICTECAEIFATLDEQKIHEQKYHCPTNFFEQEKIKLQDPLQIVE